LRILIARRCGAVTAFERWRKAAYHRVTEGSCAVQFYCRIMQLMHVKSMTKSMQAERIHALCLSRNPLARNCDVDQRQCILQSCDIRWDVADGCHGSDSSGNRSYW